HLLPKPIHRMEVLGNHFAQLVVPFFLFAPQPIAAIAAAIVLLTQLWLFISGNFAWLNVLSIVLVCAAVGDSAVNAVVPFIPAQLDAASDMPTWFGAVVVAVTILYVVLSWWPLRNLLSRDQAMNASFNRWHLANAYGAFGSVTRIRFEIIIEGTEALTPDQADWKEYEFKGKPGAVNRMPRQFAPYHLRLDWLMWFLALGSPAQRWFSVLLLRLLEADRPTLRLLRADPFNGTRPRWVRARTFRYRFTTPAEKRETGDWWVREEEGIFVRPVSLASLR
ncbi:MAG: lipase maturation factor family protein, partial [Homoserinimonas sp.]|nr:lipase maturation factor family protein [Homoserinimonas sp.]